MRPKAKEFTETKQQKKEKHMNTDASTFTLDGAAQTLRNSLKYLAFKRLRDYVQDHDKNNTRVIHETVYHFQLWDGATVMPANLDLDWKAYAIPVRTDMPGYRGIGKPKKVECVRLLALYPSDSILWAVQKTVYTPEKVSNTYFTGSSTITRLNGAAQNIPQMLDFHIDFPKHFWNEILKWVKQTKEARDPADVYLDALYDNVTRGLVPK